MKEINTDDLMYELEQYEGDIEDLEYKYNETESEPERLKLLSKIEEIEKSKRFQDLENLRDDLKRLKIVWDSYLVKKDDFVDYIKENLDDLVDADVPFILYDCIDFEKFAKKLQRKYNEVTFDGIEYIVVEI